MLPLHIYCKATGDYSFTQVAPKKLSISLYGGARKLIVGHANVPVKHKSFECFLNCRIDDDEGCRPLPGKDVNIAMGIIAIDDANSKPDTCGKMLNYFILLRCESTPKMHLHLHLSVENYGSIYGFWFFSFVQWYFRLFPDEQDIGTLNHAQIHGHRSPSQYAV